ncbi:MAG: hydrogenase maturation protease [Planctomycetota bacterium]|nr:hydrogenase maturation protease [Planctomycetota bacterium]
MHLLRHAFFETQNRSRVELTPSEQILQKKPRILIIGIGNAYRGDDAVGFVVAQRLKEQTLDYVSVLEKSGDGVALMESWKNADTVILVDAVYSDVKPGTLHRFDAHAQPIPVKFFCYSTHAFSVAEAIELSRTFNQLPPHLIVYGIEGKCFEAGAGLSLEVEEAARTVVKYIQHDIYSIDPFPGCISSDSL